MAILCKTSAMSVTEMAPGGGLQKAEWESRVKVTKMWLKL